MHPIAEEQTNHCSRNLSGSAARPRTPPSSSSRPRDRASDIGSSPPARASSSRSSPPLKSYINFLSNTDDDWNAGDAAGVDVYGMEDDDGDDFGLPSLSNMKRRSRRIAAAQDRDPARGNLSPVDLTFGFSSRRFSNSADIAIERPTPTYPIPKNSEGKILRPQYKDILKGRYA
jgi:TBC1 domain family member 2